MILIADSGSTKTDWCVVGKCGILKTIKTQGINPFHQTDSDIRDVLSNELLPNLDSQYVDALYFYGSGCRPELRHVIADTVTSLLPSCKDIEINGDLLGAARALCGVNSGIACILGTGANSCLYDGRDIVLNTPPLGYILGDEGSGAVLGKCFFNLMFKGGLPDSVCEDFYNTTGLTMADIISKVYRESMPNRFLASVSPFVHKHLGCEQVNNMVVDNFRNFFKRNVLSYERLDLPVNVVGSMAYYYQNQLAEAASKEGVLLGRILRSPIEGLVQFHSN